MAESVGLKVLYRPIAHSGSCRSRHIPAVIDTDRRSAGRRPATVRRGVSATWLREMGPMKTVIVFEVDSQTDYSASRRVNWTTRSELEQWVYAMEGSACGRRTNRSRRCDLGPRICACRGMSKWQRRGWIVSSASEKTKRHSPPQMQSRCSTTFSLRAVIPNFTDGPASLLFAPYSTPYGIQNWKIALFYVIITCAAAWW